uniref:Nucleotide-diphospho-sugar transferase domain-containing protein n=1 Tax=Chromera velia CCMP2878 TaxID=1169474 RepID=A0A0G4GZF5_9ALVE|eukprot:Cvel_23999.t1-p1 / transcript=Cvel_23999.t1 / gene=Cvel_23999 / organism=Chromera_velia_CCMP2878 / gene_product=hypothetical protein / transcript_product=hypothetical protein / location=Cvel_scaffold2543:23964-25388(+) / protein_length=475 / sequence_SO=supercontig / SO=protein_coding / is_pseudo=false
MSIALWWTRGAREVSSTSRRILLAISLGLGALSLHLLHTWSRQVRDLAFAAALAEVSQHTSVDRGVVLPLFDNIALLGASLLMELRHLAVLLPVEIPHCGDLSNAHKSLLHKVDGRSPDAGSARLFIYDVCEEAAKAVVGGSWTHRPLFCDDLAHCRRRFRSFDLKVLSVVFSRFREVMLLDADTLFFQTPSGLWDSLAFQSSGTLFFHDRIALPFRFLAQRPRKGIAKGNIHEFLEGFNPKPYTAILTVQPSDSPFVPKSRRVYVNSLSFAPSEFLLSSHSWALRSGHQADSSLLLWDKGRQRRATAILASLVSLNGEPRPNSYGDKELYWLACELAEAEYSFSPFAVGSIGRHQKKAEGGDSVLCGDAMHFLPTHRGRPEDAPPLFINSDNFAVWDLEDDTSEPLFRTAARPAEVYVGSQEERGLEMECIFDVKVLSLRREEIELVKRRQSLLAEAETVLDSVKKETSQPPRT